MLTSHEVIQIAKEELLGQPLSIQSEAAREFRQCIELEHAEMASRGIIVNLPFEL